MTQLTENTIEQSLIDQLIVQGYSYYNGTSPRLMLPVPMHIGKWAMV